MKAVKKQFSKIDRLNIRITVIFFVRYIGTMIKKHSSSFGKKIGKSSGISFQIIATANLPLDQDKSI